MSDTITVPTSVLAALGGLAADDPPVLWECSDHDLPTVSWHPVEDDHPPSDGVLHLPASAPALLRVLARYLGMTDLWPRFRWSPMWKRWQIEAGTHSSWWFSDTPIPAEDDTAATTVPALAGITNPMTALAAVLEHVAEQARQAPA